MKRQLLTKLSVLFVVILFSLMSGVALAQKKHWFVVKDKGGMCRVIEAETIAGPFKTMEQAERKAKDCPQGFGQATEQLRSPQEHAEPMRRQHQQREEVQQQHLKQQQGAHQQQQLAPQQQQQTEKMKGKAQEKTEGSKPSEEKVKEKAKEPIPSEKKN